MPLPNLPVSPFPDVPQLPGVPAVMRDPAAVGSALTSGVQGALLGKASGLSGINADFSGELDDVSSGLNGYTQTDGSDVPTDTSTPTWGIFDKDGQPAIVPDTILVVDYKNDSRISEYPQEAGAFGSYNKVETPFDMQVRMAFAGTDSEREAFLASVDAVFKSLDLFSVVTPDGVYESLTFDHRDMRRDARGGITMLTVELWAKEVRVTANALYTQSATPPDPSAPITAESPAPQTVQTSTAQPLPAEQVQAPDAADPVNDGAVQAAPPTPAQDKTTNFVSGSVNDTLGSTLSPEAAQQLQAQQEDPETLRKAGQDRYDNPPPGATPEEVVKYRAYIVEKYKLN